MNSLTLNTIHIAFFSALVYGGYLLVSRLVQAAYFIH